MAHKRGVKKAKTADINVVPLIDIVLVLLIIFMVITPLIVKQMEMDIPEKDDHPEETPPPPDLTAPPQLVILMNKDGDAYLGTDTTPVPLAELSDRLHRIVQGRDDKDKVLFFDAEDETNYGATVHVLDAVRGSGVLKIGIVTERGGMKPPQHGAPALQPAPTNAVPVAPAPAPAKKH